MTVDDRIATHRQEAFELRASSEDRLKRIDQILAIGAAFVAAVATAAVKHRELALGVPAAIFFLVTLVTQIYTDVIVVDLARQAAEAALEQEIGADALFYGQLAQPFRRGTYLSSVVAVGVVGTLLCVATTIGGGLIAAKIRLHHDPLAGHTVLIAYVVATSFFALTALGALIDFVRAGRDAKKAYADVIARLAASTPQP